MLKILSDPSLLHYLSFTNPDRFGSWLWVGFHHSFISTTIYLSLALVHIPTADKGGNFTVAFGKLIQEDKNRSFFPLIQAQAIRPSTHDYILKVKITI